MPELPEYAEKNREAWTKMSEWFREPGRRSWSRPGITWGIWDIPEAELQALGDLERFRGKDLIEMGCGTAYFSAWFARLGANPVGIDVTPAQLENARAFQKEFGIEFPLLEGNAEEAPFLDDSFDVAFSEYGASIWCDPYKWIPEVARVLRPGGELIFLRNSTISMVCQPGTGTASSQMVRPWFGLHRLEWDDDGSVEFHLPTGPMIRLLRQNGFEIVDLVEIQAPAGAETRFEYMTAEWAKQWPCEEIWRARLIG